MSSWRSTLYLGCLLLLSVGLARGSEPFDDPLRPPSRSTVRPPAPKAAPSQPVYHLCSIIIASDTRKAVINGETREVGDRFEGAEVLEIEPNSVKLRVGNRIQTLYLVPAGLKKPVGE